jgi:hypothetical protein
LFESLAGYVAGRFFGLKFFLHLGVRASSP